jgi:hypothetical protein
MAVDDFKRYYNNPEDFPVLVGSLSDSFQTLRAGIEGLALGVQPAYAELVESATVLLHWSSYPGQQTLDDIEEFFDQFVGGATSEAPIEINAWDAVVAPTTDMVYAIDFTTPPLKKATFQVILNAMHRLQAETPNQGSRLFLQVDRSDGASYPQNDHTTMFFTQAVNLPISFTVEEGQTIRVRIGIALITGAGGVAEVTGSRATIDKIS